MTDELREAIIELVETLSHASDLVDRVVGLIVNGDETATLKLAPEPGTEREQ